MYHTTIGTARSYDETDFGVETITRLLMSLNKLWSEDYSSYAFMDGVC